MTTLPTQQTQRIELLDIWRGFAILGIFMVNILVMNCAFPNREAYEQEWSSLLNQGSLRFLETFFYSKFYPIFSFLFGLGISMQVLRYRAQDQFSYLFFIRRFWGLLLLGIGHIVFLWSGDILHLYAFLGFLLIFLLPLPNIILGILILILVFFPFWGDIFHSIMAFLQIDYGDALTTYERAQLIEIYHTGSYSDIFTIRIKEYIFAAPMLYTYIAPISLSMMLLGVYVGKVNLIQQLPNWIQQHSKKIIGLTLFAFAYNAFIIYYMLPTFGRDINPILGHILTSLFFLSDVIKALAYLLLIAWLFEKDAWKKILSPLQHVGRMALSNYIFQSLIGLFAFSSLGLAWYEQLSPSQCILMVTTTFAFQIIISKWWLNYFLYGPLEWLWRCFSYGKLFPFKR